MAKQPEVTATELHLDDSAREVAVPYAGSEYLCPNCEQHIPTRKQINLSRPAKYAHVLNEIMKCPFCMFIFSYRSRAVVYSR
jgi:hypothetical protein